MSARSRLFERRRLEPCGADRRVLSRAWRDAEYCVIDVETTGLDLRRDDIVSYGAVAILNGRIVSSTSVYGLVQPTRAVSPSALTVHALRDSDLAAAAPIEACAEALSHVLAGRVLVAHAAWIEVALLGRALATAGKRPRGPILDTAALARAMGLAELTAGREPSLEALAVGLKLPVHTPHHALGDALTTATVFVAMASRLERSAGIHTVRDLERLSKRNRNR